MERIVVMVPDEMAAQIARDSRARRSPVAAIVRQAIEEYYANRGIMFDVQVEWGKRTEDTEKKEQGAA